MRLMRLSKRRLKYDRVQAELHLYIRETAKGGADERELLIRFKQGITRGWSLLSFLLPRRYALQSPFLGSGLSVLKSWRPRRDLNPCYRRERAMS